MQPLDGTDSVALPAVFDFLFCFMEMKVDGYFALLGERQRLGEIPVVDCVRGMRGKAETE